MILAALGLTWLLRLGCKCSTETWSDRYSRALLLFLFPPLLLMMTGLAVLCMGPQGQMVGLRAGWFSYLLTLGFLGVAGVKCLKLAWLGCRSVQQARTYPSRDLGITKGRVLDTPVLFSALIGFWQPELVVSQGLLNTLDNAHFDAVIAHEQAHYYYRDTFWFFWLGWVRDCTAWLPNTESLWQELLLLRELRADCRAAQQVDPLLLAESLLRVVSDLSKMPSENFCAAFSAVAQRNRLTERIDALLAEPEATPQLNLWSWAWLLLTFLPLAAIPFHT
jgi:Zn-dependent protease with chaperone function